MWTLLPILLLWFAAWITRPQRPYGMSQDAFLVYRRAMSQWEWYRAVAIVLTIVLIAILLLSHRHTIDPNLARLRNPYSDMGHDTGPLYQWVLNLDGTWTLKVS